MKHVLFVCLGNVCRSAMAEAMFRRMIKQHHLENQIQVKSAGTSNEEEGNQPLPEVQAVMRKHGLDPSSLRAKQIDIHDIQWADIIIGMDAQNIQFLKQLVPTDQQDKIHLCLNIDPKTHGQDIPDPWYTRKFEFTYDALNRSLPLWFQSIQNNQ